jgi:RNA polymerase sigma-70 factor (ECF subfamily)
LSGLGLNQLDNKLIDRCIKGDRLALEQLYTSYAPKMKAICVRYVHSIYEAEDVFQEAFIKVLRDIRHFNYQGSFDGWIRKIVVRTAIDHYKNNRLYAHSISYEEIEEPEGNASDLADQLSANELLEIIKKLPLGYNLVFNLYAIEGYSHGEIAEMLSISESTSRSQLCKARNFIKEELKQHHFLLNERRYAG